MTQRRRPGSAASTSRTRLVTEMFGALAVLFLMGPVCGPPAPPPSCDPGGPATTGDQVHDICTYVECVNHNLAAGSHTIADTVACLPKNCCITLTMSDTSAQKGCFSPEDDDNPDISRCQLPRVLLTCPGPPLLMPSYLLCPTGSESEGHLGSNRVEIGQAVDEPGNMRMADIPIEPGPHAPLDPNAVMSKVNPSGSGTKGCNDSSIGCHEVQPPLASAPNEQLSQPIDSFANANCIIDTDCCGHSAIEGPAPSDCNNRAVTAQTLEQVCSCIGNAIDSDTGHPLDTDQGRIMRSLCDALETYQNERGACTAGSCPPATGPACLEPGASCDPATGAITGVLAGYKCQAVADDDYQCIADCPCRNYDWSGGGKFLVSGAVSMVRIALSGLAPSSDAASFDASHGITGELSAFEYASHTLIHAVSFSSFTMTTSGADFSATGKASGTVNGSFAHLEFAVDKTGAVTTFEVRDADTSTFLAGGTGEADRYGFTLTVSPP